MNNAINIDNFNSFFNDAMKMLAGKPHYIRTGQCLFNYLYEVNPALADKIRGTNADPFYNDQVIGAFWVAVADEILWLTET